MDDWDEEPKTFKHDIWVPRMQPVCMRKMMIIWSPNWVCLTCARFEWKIPLSRSGNNDEKKKITNHTFFHFPFLTKTKPLSHSQVIFKCCAIIFFSAKENDCTIWRISLGQWYNAMTKWSPKSLWMIQMNMYCYCI